MKKGISDLAKGIMAGLESALAHAKGKPTSGTVEHVVFVPDVKAIREGAGNVAKRFFHCL